MIEFIKSHWAEIGVILLGLVRAAEAIAELTPSERDDTVVAKIATMVRNFFSLGTGN